MLNKDQERMEHLEDIHSFRRAECEIVQFSPHTGFVFIMKAISVA